MKVLCLGTGAAEGIPALFCDCNICVEAHHRGGKNLRTRSSIFIDNALKIDFPPDSLAHVHSYRICFAHLRHLLFTHSHDDHLAPRELQYLSPTFAPARKEIAEIYGATGLQEKILPSTADFFEAPPLRFHTLAPFEPARIGGYVVTPILAHHKTDETCFNYLITDLDGGSDSSVIGRTLLYGTDTGWYDPPTWDFLKGITIHTAILECGKGISGSLYDGHLSFDDAVRVHGRLIDFGALAADAPCYLTHIAHTGLLLHEELEAKAAMHGMLVAYDGLIISV